MWRITQKGVVFVKKHIFVFLVLIIVILVLNFRADRVYFIESENLANYTLTPINWTIEKALEVNPTDFLKTHTNKIQFQEGISTYNYNLLGVDQVKSDILGPISGLWLVKEEYNRNGLNYTHLIWPLTVQNDWLVVSRLEYPEPTKCNPQSYCVVGLDYHFRKHKFWYQIPIIRHIYPYLNKKADPFATQDIYLSVYKIPQTKRLVLSNPCPNNEIIAYLLSGVSVSNNQYVTIRCSSKDVYTGELSI